MALFILIIASVMPYFMALNLLGFIKNCFVGKLTKRMNGYNKRAHWSNGRRRGQLIDVQLETRQHDPAGSV